MKILRSVLLVAYIFLLVFLGVFGLVSIEDSDSTAITLVSFFVMVGTQILLLFGVGTSNITEKLTSRRLLIPVIVLSFMMTVLTFGLAGSLGELFESRSILDTFFDRAWGFFFIGVSWIVWSVVFFRHLKGSPRHEIFRRTWVVSFLSSVVALLITVPNHIYVMTERSGCLTGMFTRLGVFLAAYVLVWAFGPGIIVLFLRERFSKDTKPGQEGE
jgi:hypothetical protein